MSTLKVDNLQTTAGAGLYTAKAWACIDGIGVPSITADGNVSSITDNGTGTYTLNYSSSFSTGNYSWVGTAPNFLDNTKRSVNVLCSNNDGDASVKTTAATRIRVGQSNSLNSYDTKNVSAMVME